MSKKKILDKHILKPAGLIEAMTSRVEEVKNRADIIELFRPHYAGNFR